MRAGFSPRRSLVAILLMGAGYCLIGILGEVYEVPAYIMFWGFMALLVIYSAAIMNIWKLIRVFRAVKRHLLPA